MICCCVPLTQTYFVFGGTAAGTNTYNWNSGWTTKTNLPSGSAQFAGSTPVAGSAGFIYTITRTGASRLVYQYYPDTFTSDTAMPSPGRRWNSGCPISSNGYSFGGDDGGTNSISQNDQIAPGSPSTWTTKAAMPATRTIGAATYIGSKGYYFCGSNIAAGVTTQEKNTYEYDPSGDSWATKTSGPVVRTGAAGFTISARAYIIDGGPSSTIRNDSYVVDTWTAKGSPLGSGVRQYPAGASPDTNGTGWITGYWDGSSDHATHDEYTPDSWTNRTNAAAVMESALALPI